MTNSQSPDTDQAKTLREMNSTPQPSPGESDGRVTTVYSVTSGKGGVGKTAVTANLACSLAKMGKKVLILDADIGLANIDVVFGLTPKYNLNHFFSGESQLDDILVEGPLGIKILPAGSGIQSFIRLDGHQKMRLLDALSGMDDFFDYVLIDTEAGISENVTYFNTAAQKILVVTTPEPTSITDAYALMKLLSVSYHEKHFNLVVNQIQSEEDALDVYKKLTMVSGRYLDIFIDYMGSIPADGQMVEAIRKQKVITQMLPESKITQSFERLATRISSEPPHSEPKGNLQFFWNRLLNFGE